jgi:PAS domain S-box-containing protein
MTAMASRVKEDTHDELREEKRTLELLNETGAALARELDLDRLVQIVTDAGVQLVGAAFGAFFYNTRDERGQHLTLYALSGAPRAAFERFPLPGKTALFGPTLDGRGIVRCEDVLVDPRYGKSPPYCGMPPGHLPVRSYLSVPVVSSSGEVHGGLFFGHPDPGVFTERGERIITGIAAQAAIAMDNARLLLEVRNSERRFRALIEHSADAIAVLDASGSILYFSPSASAIEGHAAEDMIGASCIATTHPEDAPIMQQALARSLRSPGDAIHVALRRAHANGQWLWVEGTLTNLLGDVAVRGLVANYRDVTARRRAQEAQIRSQKMEALGTLAGGIAHDFNNILLAICGNARLAADDLPRDHNAQQSLAEIARAAQRATDLVRRILAFSRQQEPKRESLHLQPVVHEAVTLLRSTLPTLIEIRTSLASDAPAVLADPTQIHQIVINLVTNAAHAIGERSGVIEVGVAAAPLDPAVRPRELKPGPHVLLWVSDTGAGIDRLTLERIFDPFFTTKPPGRGTGLGLSVVEGIMKSHEGAIHVQSEPGRGATFRMYFPAAHHAPRAAEASGAGQPRGGGQRILCVDDDEAIVSMTRRLLERAGYRVCGSTSPAHALETFRSAPADFDVVITDVTMPGMSGFDLAHELRKIRPDVPILATSGYVRPEDRERARERGLQDLILKPDSTTELERVLARILGG